jgi:predicted CXXCH cytochrome family protein
LTFFFDGVPDTTKKELPVISDSLKTANVATMQDASVIEAKSEYVFHPPYSEGQCENCHNNGSLTMPQPQLCYQCHEDFSKKFAYLHGPVAGGYCTSCHHPHMAKEKKLLTRTGQDLCLYCHESKDVLKNENHSGIGETKCTECHNPHGGTDKFIFN